MNDRHSTTTVQLTTLVLGLLVITASAAAPVLAADSDDEDDERTLSERATDLLGGGANLAKAGASIVSGALSNLDYKVARFGNHDPERTTGECARDIQHEVNNHSADYEDYINERIGASNDTDVFEIRCQYDDDGEVNTSTTYLVADVTDGSYGNLSAVSSTNRTVDETAVLTGKSTEEMPDELVTFRKEYVATNTTPPGSLEPKLTMKYGGYVHGTPDFLPPISDLDSEEGDS